MPDDPARRNGSGIEGLAALGIAVLAIGCCAGVPLLAAVAAGGVAAGTLLGVGAGLVAAVVLIAAVALRARARRHACDPRAPRRSGTSHRGSAASDHGPALSRRR